MVGATSPEAAQEALKRDSRPSQGSRCTVRAMKRRVLSLVACVLMAAVLVSVGGAAAGSPAPSQQPVVVHVSEGGFHWGDAAIGAAGAVGLILIAAAMRLAWGTAGPRAQGSAGSRFRAGRRFS
jgi:hypothetical protein